ncbi:aminoacetone oxidase family FAD-binding enzyme [Agrobacterium vitis]|uniref:Aminoacetone oxidase family FAD-binding enzyme n=1 Tax=Agrobacterium vitis TaxID=373 RepID=A0ABD6GF09_AGRVI|nr:NAD(P)/FAD-dependent oxidoreductase [Agrobacterium vitis]MUO81862.1 aminoacetone oxidase family FAD-binding enzyme [Agrobacterium vitis]MUO97517.1 aminoacetone oxidase family FAD-binding enzyme [Agrobacterium vitis]MUP08037.1 aminoacetone oxidase family FAD-binding enzyme [Agrobacterium vitis]MUZ85247.1 aminoacetone oxidase family FAD-binding enzyme [Agrobacterium vitis]MVA12667.1 aminoacetone oxidase family FAD-binding enzyme [Agrobacterium vitis]
MTLDKRVDVVVIGAGAAGMMAAIRAGQRGRSVAVLDHAKAPGEKIRISGGGRCNFTNIHAGPKQYLSSNPHFAKSALARFTPADFIAMVEGHRIAWHEKTLGQLFCDDSAKDIIRMLLEEMRAAGARLHMQTDIRAVEKTPDGFRVETSEGTIVCQSLIIATGGKSIPKMGATGFAYRLAEQFGVGLVETRPALVPLTLEPGLLEELAPLSGMAVDVLVRHGKTEFREALLFTHRGLSGPAILQISSYWREGEAITLSLQPELDFLDLLKTARRDNGRQAVQTVLGQYLPKRLAQYWTERHGLEKPLADLSDKVLASIADALRNWQIKPAGSEGYRTAEVTLGGIDTQALDSKTMQAKAVPGLYFIGEAVDVTGWLGGYNFQWAWASGHAAGLAA